eukprot:c5429_g1_i1.p1 GENE.c5429_g1_i1~~c5429_g1_i1.p1  ORF type:complete len:356 (+),score=75.80 c5429_g1_i1:49-1068(+)
MEASIICIDNSEFMRNSDYVPSRFEAQHDAVNFLAGAKTQQHPESTVGIVAMSSVTDSVEVLLNLTNDFGQLITSIHKAKIHGKIHFSTSMNVARLALKHRQNRHQAQRIIAFVGSPIEEDTNELTQLGRKLKKNNISVDIVNFGQEAENTEKLEAFVDAVNRDGSSHLVTVPPGPHILSDILVSSAIAGQTSDGQPGYMGVDELDPELAMALRMSMEEHERAQRGGAEPAAAAAPSAAPAPAAMVDDNDLDEEMRLAIEMSLADSQTASTPAETSSFAAAVSSLPGVDLSDPNVQSALQNANANPSEDVEMRNAAETDKDKNKSNNSGNNNDNNNNNQ